MGGTRCYFRECHVGSAKFPRMHFFRFPLKECERYKKWRQFSKMEKILKFPEMRRKNTSICGRHFRFECFMNYKMDRLTPSAVPTIMRLSDDKALDYELDIENGVLVTLEKTKFKHLIPPEDFECPLSLKNDKILLNILSEYFPISTHTDYVDLDKSESYEELTVEKTEKSFDNSVEILETIQVATPRLKRVPRLKRSIDNGERPTSSASLNNKKCKILNLTYCEGGDGPINESNNTFASRSVQRGEVNSDDIDLVETDHIENTIELMNAEQQFLLTSEVYIKDDDSDIEVFEVHKQENSSHYELPINDSDTTIVELKSDNQIYYSDRPNPDLSKIQSLETDLQKKMEDFDTLQVKFNLLEAENNELKKLSKERGETYKKMLLLQIENNKMKQSLNELKTLNDKLQNSYEENRKLKEKTANMESLKSEVLSRKEETKELKRLLESFKSKEQDDNLPKTKLEEEISILKRNLEQSQQQLHDTNTELNELKLSFDALKNEHNGLFQHKKNLEQSLENIQNSFELKQKDYKILKADFDNLRKENNILEEKYWKLQASKNQEPLVSTSIKNENNQNPAVAAMQPTSSISFSKAQLFNGIKRYICASMVSLLRMEMFGSAEREWKSDERLVAANILGLGEEVYKYFTDEWRIRLPALRDVRNWSNRSQVDEVEEDL